MQKVHRVGATFTSDDDIVVFPLRNISVGEENAYTKRFLNIGINESPEAAAKKEHEIFVDSLASWSVEQGPCRPVQTGDGVIFEPLYPDAETPAAATQEFFKDSDADKMRIAIQIVLGFRNRLQPKLIFY